MNDLSDRRSFVNGSTATVCHQFVVLHDVHVAVVIVLVECVEATLVTDEPAGTFFLVATAVILFAIEITPDSVYVAFVNVGN